jgi:general stress protein 26
MNIAPQSSPELTRLAELIEDLPVAMLTTLQAGGTLASRPMAVLEMDAQGALWFLTDPRSSKVDHLQAVNLCFVDRSAGAYVSLSGRAEVDTNPERIQRLWTPMAKPWFPEGPESRHIAALKFVPDAADYWDAPHSTMVRALGAVASVITGKPVAAGEHGSLKGLSAAAS